MEAFIKSLTIEQLENIKIIIDTELSNKKAVSKEHTVKKYQSLTGKELKSIKRKYNQQLDKVRNKREYDIIQFHIDCINCVLEGFKICV